MKVINYIVIALLLLITVAEMVFFTVLELNDKGGMAMLKYFYLLAIVPNLFGTICTVVLCIALLRIRETIKS